MRPKEKDTILIIRFLWNFLLPKDNFFDRVVIKLKGCSFLVCVEFGMGGKKNTVIEEYQASTTIESLMIYSF